MDFPVDDMRPPNKAVIQDELDQLITYKIITNDNSETAMKLLSNTKFLFQKQLHKMPGEYIARLVYDENHHGMIILKNPYDVQAGILYRIFREQGFVEIVFCAVHSNVQVRGYGGRLMNKLKDHIYKTEGIRYYMTYADNYAVGYFRKQGFTKEITLSESIWKGYIKDYEGGTMMQCITVPRVSYSEVNDLIAIQKKAVIDAIRKRVASDTVHPGLTYFKENGNSIDPFNVPGIKEAGWSPDISPSPKRSLRSALNRRMQRLMDELLVHAAAWPFVKPVSKDDVPDYYEVISHPMDLSTVEANVEADLYRTVDAFKQDIQLIFSNCRHYNEENSVYVRNANRLETFFKQKIREWDMIK